MGGRIAFLLCRRGCGAELPCGSGVDRLLTCACYLGTMGDLWLIPVRTGLPAVEVALEHVDDSARPTAEELRSLADVALRYVLVNEAPLRYAEAVSGRPCRN